MGKYEMTKQVEKRLIVKAVAFLASAFSVMWTEFLYFGFSDIDAQTAFLEMITMVAGYFLFYSFLKEFLELKRKKV